MYAVMYWSISDTRVDGPYDLASSAREFAQEALIELRANGDEWHAGVFELPDFLEV